MMPRLDPVVGGFSVRQWGVVLALLGLALAHPVIAQTTLYWDRVNGSGAGTGATLNGTWDTATTSNWNSNSSGSGSRTTYTSGSDAVFSAGTSASGYAYTITVSGTQSASSISIKEGTVASDVLPTIALETANHFLMLARELVWENVRLAI